MVVYQGEPLVFKTVRHKHNTHTIMLLSLRSRAEETGFNSTNLQDGFEYSEGSEIHKNLYTCVKVL